MKDFQSFYNLVKSKYPEICSKSEQIVKKRLMENPTETEDLEQSVVSVRQMLILEEYHKWIID